MLLPLKKFAAAFAGVVLAASLLHAQELSLSDRWMILAKQIQAKLDAGKKTEPEFKDELTALDKLIASVDSSQTNDIAQLLFQKAELYYVIFHDLDQAGPLYRKVSVDYPGYRLAGPAAQNADIIEHAVIIKHIHDALAPGTVFPDFAEKDMDGKSLSVSNYAGKVVLMDFWATWCPNCTIELPAIKKLYKTYHDKGLEIIGVSLDTADGRDLLAAYLKKNPEMKWPEYYDGMYWTNKLAVKYGIQQAPSNILVNRDGKIIATDLHGDDLEGAITTALVENKKTGRPPKYNAAASH